MLVTGAAGLLGHWLLRQAPDWADAVALVHRRPVNHVPTVATDLRDADQVRAAVAEARPSIVIHAAYAKDEPSIVTATRHVVDAAASVGVAVVHVSTDAVFSGDGVSRGEAAVPDPVFDYGRWKAAADAIVQRARPTAAIVRPSLLVSIDPDDHVVAQLRDGDAAAPTAWFTDEIRRPAWTGEVAAAIWRIAALPAEERAGAWHLMGPERLSRFEIARRLVGRLGRPDDVVTGDRRPPDTDRPRDLELSDRRARQVIGWSPTPIA